MSVDFLDERKFAKAAAAKARAGAEIVGLTYRQQFVEDARGQWQGYKDPDDARAWGVSEWGNRAGQGAFIDWVVANALLPSVDPNPEHRGIQKVDRTTVLELRQIAASYHQIQAQLDAADVGLNPVGLVDHVVPFDIDPTGIARDETHFEQIYARAVQAMNNAIAVFNHANNSTQLLRRQADKVSDFQINVREREIDLNNRLIELFGYPYEDDIGPTGSYATGYDGPDLYHYMYVDPSELLGEDPSPVETFQVDFEDREVAEDGTLSTSTTSVLFHLSSNGLGLIKPPSWTGKRRAPGQIQVARSDLIQTRARFERALLEYENQLSQIEDQALLLEAQHNLNTEEIKILNRSQDTQESLNDKIKDSRTKQLGFRAGARSAVLIANALAEFLPKSVGLASDVTAPGRGAIRLAGAVLSEVLTVLADVESLAELGHQQAKEIEQSRTNIELTTLRQEQGILQQVKHIEQLIRQEAALRLEIHTLYETLQQAAGRYLSTLAQGQRLLEDRLRFRAQTAAQIQEFRYKDMAFRIFRNDALQKYRAQFDLAARYVYLTAKAYDFETNLLPDDNRGPAQAFLTDIIRSRSLGLIQNGIPVTGSGDGDPGLSDPLARMFSNFNLVLKPQLGFDNPQTETGRFSLRSELFRTQTNQNSRLVWRETLARHVVPNLLDLPEFQRFCIPFQPQENLEPAIVIPFGSTINEGENFFGWPAGGGDNSYDSTHFATKIRSVGVWFSNYNNLGGGMINTPRVYLVPIGSDVLRSPTGNRGEIREWKILDQVLPVPFPLSGAALNNPNWIPVNDTLSDSFAAIRRYPRFRAFHDAGIFNPSETINDSRLIGRSVWNTRWLLIIPAATLHSNREEGIQRFIHGRLLSNGTRDGNGVSDIKIFFQTYAYSGI